MLGPEPELEDRSVLTSHSLLDPVMSFTPSSPVKISRGPWPSHIARPSGYFSFCISPHLSAQWLTALLLENSRDRHPASCPALSLLLCLPLKAGGLQSSCLHTIPGGSCPLFRAFSTIPGPGPFHPVSSSHPAPCLTFSIEGPMDTTFHGQDSS